jgi:hypothetical protein
VERINILILEEDLYLESLKKIEPELDKWSNDIYNVLKITGFSEEAIESVIRNATTRKTKLFGKYVGCPLWSKDAISKYKSLLEGNQEIKWGKFFVHEHVVPQCILVEIFSLWSQHITKPTIKAYLRWMLLGVVVLKDEDNKLTNLKLRENMPDDWWDPESYDYQNHWIRYKAASIEVHACIWDNKRIISHNEISYFAM